MAILDRISTILRANINALLDQAEDPEKVIDQIIRDQAEALTQLRGQVAQIIAEEKRLEAETTHNQQLALDWGRKAELAVRKSADDLAREALHRQGDYERNAAVYQKQYADQRAIAEQMKAQLHALEEKYEETRRNRDLLIARHRRAEAQQKVTKVAAALTAKDPGADLARLEERIEREEALASAQAELASDTLESRFAALESGDSEIEDRLAALKAKVQAPQLPPAADETEAEQS